MIEWANRLWQAFLPLGGAFIIIGIQVQISYGWWAVAALFWGLSVACFMAGFGGLIWSYRMIREKEREDALIV